MRCNHQNGGIIVLLFVVVGVFATITVSMSKMMSEPPPTMEKQKSKLSESVNYNCTSIIDNTIIRLQVMNECADNEISYEVVDGRFANDDAPLNKSCHVFNDKSGGVTPGGVYASAPDPSDPEVASISVAGDTSSIVTTALGVYFRCQSWSGTQCNLSISPDGASFTSASSLCVKKGTFIDPTRALGGTIITGLFRASLCTSACGSPSLGGSDSSSGSASYYIKNDLSIEPYTGSCARSLGNVKCDCWQ